MKIKKKKLFKNILAFIIGSVISGSFAVVAAVSSTNVSYSTSSSASNGATKTNVSGAIDELYTRSNQCKYKFIDKATWSTSTSDAIGTIYRDTNVSVGTDISCFSTRTFTSDGLLVVTLVGIHFGSTSSSAHAIPDLKYTLTGSASLVGYTYAAGYRINYEDLYSKTYVFKVKAGDKISDVKCSVGGHTGRIYGFSNFIKAS